MEKFGEIHYLCIMIISDKLKQVIFKKLYKDLSHVEIICHNNSIWFIDRENKYWYLEYKKDGIIFWRYPFFNSFFNLFSLKYDDYKSIISEWLEEVLNCKVDTTDLHWSKIPYSLEEVLNCKVDTTYYLCPPRLTSLEEVLNCKVDTTIPVSTTHTITVGEVLKS